MVVMNFRSLALMWVIRIHELPYQPGDEQAFVITFRNNNSGGGTDLTGIRIGGQLLVDDNGLDLDLVMHWPNLWHTDLEYFLPGDVVQGDWNQNEVWSSLGTPEGETTTGY